MNMQAMIDAVVPTGKMFAWLAVTGATLFMAGVGFATNVGAYADLPQFVAELQVKATSAETIHTGLQAGIDEGKADRARITCLARLSVEGVRLSPLEIDERCP